MVGIEACKEMLMAMMDVGVVAMRIAKDGKLDLADLAQLTGLIASQSEIMTAVKDAGQIPSEISDLSDDEVRSLIEIMLKAFHAIKEA